MKATTTVCAHDWQPIDGWTARYRCSICHAVGCKFGVLPRWYGVRGVQIQPYRCGSRADGPRCKEPAVHVCEDGKLRCAAHRPGHTARARRALAAVPTVTTVRAHDEVRPVAGGDDGPRTEVSLYLLPVRGEPGSGNRSDDFFVGSSEGGTNPVGADGEPRAGESETRAPLPP